MPPEFEGKVDQILGTGNDFCFPGKATQIMPGIAVVAFDGNRMRFANDVALAREHCRKSIPIICVKSDFSRQVLKGL